MDLKSEISRISQLGLKLRLNRSRPMSSGIVWIRYRDTNLFVNRIDDHVFAVAEKVHEGVLRYVGEVRSDDRDRSWKFRVIRRRFCLEGRCGNLGEGVACIARALWG
jgi:hypothetical protein